MVPPTWILRVDSATWNFSLAPLACQQTVPFSGGQSLLDMDDVARASGKFIYRDVDGQFSTCKVWAKGYGVS